jgi:hypothetical protein
MILGNSELSRAQFDYIYEISPPGGSVVEGVLELSGRVNENVTDLRLNIENVGHEVIVDEFRLSIWNYNWTYKWDTTKVPDGVYEIAVTAYNKTEQLERIITVVSIENVKDESSLTEDQALIMGVVLIIFIIIKICILIIDRKLIARKLKALNLVTKNISHITPRSAYTNTTQFLLTLFIIPLIFIGFMTDATILTIFLIVSGMTALAGIWGLTHRGIASKLALMVCLGCLWIGLSILIFTDLLNGTEKMPKSLAVAGSIVLLGSLVTYSLILILVWRMKIRAQLPAKVTLVVTVISGVLLILAIAGIIFAAIEILGWEIVLLETIGLLWIMSILSWFVYRYELIYFETREESRTSTTKNITFNMFNIDSIPMGLFAKEYKKRMLGKISYEINSEDEISIGIISVIDDWDTQWELLYRLMAGFINKMRKESFADARGVTLNLYSSDADLDKKLELCKYFGFVVISSGREKQLGYYHLELGAKPGLFGARPQPGTSRNFQESSRNKDSSTQRPRAKPNKLGLTGSGRL